MFRFTIRELVLVTAVVALAIGWAADHWRTARDRNAWRTRSYYWVVAANTAKDRLVESGHTVNFREDIGAVEIDDRVSWTVPGYAAP